MGITTAILKVKANRKAKKFENIEFLVDSGAVYSLVPGKILDKLKIEPYREMSFSLADGTSIKRKLGMHILNFKTLAVQLLLSMEKKVIALCWVQQRLKL